MTDSRVPNPVTAALQKIEPAPAVQTTDSAPVASHTDTVSAVRQYLLSRGSSSGVDRVFSGAMLLCALGIFALVALIAV